MIKPTANSAGPSPLKAHPKQTGYTEKLAATQLQVMEPLTRLDLLRIFKNTQRPPVTAIIVATKNNLNTIQKLEDSYYTIDLADDKEEALCWVFLEIRRARVYSQAQLPEADKIWLNGLCNADLSYEGLTVAGGTTSGYALFSWYDREILKSGNCQANSNLIDVRLVSGFAL